MSRAAGFSSRELWYLAAAPAAWLAHFVFLYCASAIVCARPGLAYAAIRVPGLVATLVALGVAGAVAWRGYRALRRDLEPATLETPPRRQRFLGGLLLGLAAVAGTGIAVTAIVPIVIGGCR